MLQGREFSPCLALCSQAVLSALCAFILACFAFHSSYSFCFLRSRKRLEYRRENILPIIPIRVWYLAFARCHTATRHLLLLSGRPPLHFYLKVNVLTLSFFFLLSVFALTDSFLFLLVLIVIFTSEHQSSEDQLPDKQY